MTESHDASALRCTLLVLRCANLEAARSFYEALGARFVEEKHGEGPPPLRGQHGRHDTRPAPPLASTARLMRCSADLLRCNLFV